MIAPPRVCLELIDALCLGCMLTTPVPLALRVVGIREPAHLQLHAALRRQALNQLPCPWCDARVMLVDRALPGQEISTIAQHLVTLDPHRLQVHRPLCSQPPHVHCSALQHLTVLGPVIDRRRHRRAVRQ
eukprot:1062217-Rhodomonas_salina.1